MTRPPVDPVDSGLAGSEASWLLVELGYEVRLREMRRPAAEVA